MTHTIDLLRQSLSFNVKKAYGMIFQRRLLVLTTSTCCRVMQQCTVVTNTVATMALQYNLFNQCPN